MKLGLRCFLNQLNKHLPTAAFSLAMSSFKSVISVLSGTPATNRKCNSTIQKSSNCCFSAWVEWKFIHEEVTCFEHNDWPVIVYQLNVVSSWAMHISQHFSSRELYGWAKYKHFAFMNHQSQPKSHSITHWLSCRSWAQCVHVGITVHELREQQGELIWPNIKVVLLNYSMIVVN